MWLACDHDCTDSDGRTWEAGVPQELGTDDGAALLAIPGGGFTAAEAPAPGAPSEPAPKRKPPAKPAPAA